MSDSSNRTKSDKRNGHSAQAAMLIRSPAADVFGAFASASKITQFWLESTSGPLHAGAEVDWTFRVPGATEKVTVTSFDPPRTLAFDWADGLSVELRFQPHGAAATEVRVTVTGFSGDDAAAQAINATEGFAIVLCDLKTLLETGRSAGLVKAKAELIAAARGAGEA